MELFWPKTPSLALAEVEHILSNCMTPIKRRTNNLDEDNIKMILEAVCEIF